MTQTPPKKSDLGVRTLSAIVMLAVAGGALWAGGIWLQSLIAVVALAAFVELASLALKATSSLPIRVVAIAAGAGYIAFAAITLAFSAVFMMLLLIGAVIFVDVFAYFAGRTIGGPKIAPAISPSKTWAGLAGGVVGAAVFALLFLKVWGSGGMCLAFNPVPEGEFAFDGPCSSEFGPKINQITAYLVFGLLVAVVAQAGDFFESWLKRRAGVKDSGNLIPGHGGVFDRVDGLMAVAFVAGLLMVSGSFTQ